MRDLTYCHYSCKVIALKKQAIALLLSQRRCVEDLLWSIWQHADSCRLSMQVLCVCPSACSVLTCNLCKIATVLFLVHCSVKHLEFLIHKYISSWWYIWKSHRVLPPPLAPQASDPWQRWASKPVPLPLFPQHLACFWSGQQFYLHPLVQMLPVAIRKHLPIPLWSTWKEGAWYKTRSSPQLW